MESLGLNALIQKKKNISFDPMLFEAFKGLDQSIFKIHITPDPIIQISDVDAYNKQEVLALSSDEVNYLVQLSKKIGRKLTDSEVFGFSQVNSEHCLLYTSPSPRD